MRSDIADGLQSIRQSLRYETHRRVSNILMTDTVLSAVQVMIDELEVLRAARDGSCYAFLYPQRAKADRDIASYFPPELGARDLRVFDEVLQSAAKPAAARIRKAESEKLIEALMPALVEKQGLAALQALAQPDASDVDKETLCRATQGLYKEILALPRAQAVMVLRFIFGSN